MTDVKDLFIVFLAGLIIGWVAKEITGGAVRASTKEISNSESWDMFEDEGGHLRVVVKRKVTR